ncbi:MAG: glycosyltransferase family 4 protein [Verrucomicrobiota bacterium]
MRIALCLECPLHQHGGVEVLVRELIRGLHQKFELYLVSADLGDVIQASSFGPMLKGCLPYDPLADKRQEAARIAQWGREEGIDLFHFHHGGTYTWGSRTWTHCVITEVANAGFRCVSTNHGAFGLMGFVGEQRPLGYKLAAMCLCWPAKLRQVASVEWEATVSQHDWKAVQRWFFPLRHKFIQIYHSMLDGSEVFTPQKRNIILCLGTVGARKGQPYLAEAFGQIAHKHPDWRLVIAGRHGCDLTTHAMFAAIRKHGIEDQVDVLTEVPDAQAIDLLRHAAIFAMPSLAEGLGLSLQEAMFHGAACAGTTAGGITDMIEHEKTGLLVPPADPSALAAALERLITDPSLRARLAETGRRSIPAKGMTRQGMWQRHAQLYLG